MTGPSSLRDLVDQERAILPDPKRMDRTWRRLSRSVALGALAPPGVCAAGVLKVGTTLTVAQWIGISVLGAAGLAGAGTVFGVWAQRGHTEPAPAVAAPAGPRAVSPKPALPAAAEASNAHGSDWTTLEPVSPEELPALHPASRGTPGSESDPGSTTRAGVTFDQELALIKKAHVELDSGRTRAALAALHEHARRFPSGVFLGEREALSALALCAGGQPAAGRAIARRFVRAYPNSPLLDRVVRVCAIDKP